MEFAGALAHYAQGLLLTDSDMYSTNALAEFELVMEMDGSSVEIPLKLANTYRVLGRTNDAVRILARLRRDFPHDDRVRLVIAYMYLGSKNFEMAGREYRGLIRSSPTEPYAYLGLSRACVGLNREDAAFDTLLEAMRKVNDPTLVYTECVSLTDQDVALNRIPQAIRRFELLHAARPDHLETAFRLIGLYLLADNATQAMHTLNSSPPAIRDSPPFLAATGVVFQDFDHHAEAAEIFREAESIAKSPGHEQDGILTVQFYYRFGSACDRIGDYARAMAAFERCIELDPNCHEALNNIAYMWAEHGTNLVQATDYVRRALQFEAHNPAYVDTLGWIYYNQKNFHAALEQLLTAQQLMPDDPSISEHLGDAYEALQDHELAIVYWQESLRLDPDNKAVAAKVNAFRKAIPTRPATPVETGKQRPLRNRMKPQVSPPAPVPGRAGADERR